VKIQKATEEKAKEIDNLIEKLKIAFKDENPDVCYTVMTFFIVRYAYNYQSKKELFELINNLWEHIKIKENPDKKESKIAKFGEKVRDFFGFKD
jgi:hypothetical protein